MMFLTDDEVVSLTGYKAAAWQARWLAERGVRYTRNGAGKVVVLRSAVEAMYGSGGGPRGPEPRWDHLLTVR